MPARPVILALALAAGLAAIATPARATEPLLLGDDERLLVLAPHPDDETLAAGGLIQEALGLDLPVRVCFFTMGDNNEIAALFTRRHPALLPASAQASGLRRQNEALAAVTQLGLSTNDVVFLGYPDSGTLDIWDHHWRTVPPYRSPLTRANSVPYDSALTPGSAYAGEDILDDLADVIRDFEPTHILVPHPADHNIDHRALYLFARVALWNLAEEGIEPAILAGPVHFTQWPETRGYQPDRPAVPPPFLADTGKWLEYALAPFQVSNKLAAIRRHHSQFLPSSAYLQPFIRKTELFNQLPDPALPRGSGSIDRDETDDTQFRPNPDLFRDLADEADSWNEIAGQNAAEIESLDGFDNDFVHRTLSGDGQNLTLTFRFRQPVAPPVALSVRLFGYRADTRFGDMPKIEIKAEPAGDLAVLDLDTPVPATVEIVPGPENEISLRVPLALLGNPQKLLVGAKLVKGSLPIDGVPWLALDLGDMPPVVAAPTAVPASAPAPAPALAPPPEPTAPAEPAVDTVPPPAPPPEPRAKPRSEKSPAAKPEPRPAVKPAAEPAPPAAPPALAPRVNLPSRPIPEHTEANEPVVW